VLPFLPGIHAPRQGESSGDSGTAIFAGFQGSPDSRDVPGISASHPAWQQKAVPVRSSELESGHLRTESNFDRVSSAAASWPPDVNAGLLATLLIPLLVITAVFLSRRYRHHPRRRPDSDSGQQPGSRRSKDRGRVCLGPDSTLPLSPTPETGGPGTEAAEAEWRHFFNPDQSGFKVPVVSPLDYAGERGRNRVPGVAAASSLPELPADLLDRLVDQHFDFEFDNETAVASLKPEPPKFAATPIESDPPDAPPECGEQGGPREDDHESRLVCSIVPPSETPQPLIAESNLKPQDSPMDDKTSGSSPPSSPPSDSSGHKPASTSSKPAANDNASQSSVIANIETRTRIRLEPDPFQLRREPVVGQRERAGIVNRIRQLVGPATLTATDTRTATVRSDPAASGVASPHAVVQDTITSAQRSAEQLLLQQKVADLRKELATHRGAAETHRQHLARLKSELGDLHQQLASAAHDNKTLQQKLETVATDQKKQQRQLSRSQSHQQTLLRQLKQAGQIQDSLQQQLNTALADNESLQQQLATASGEQQKHRDRLSEAESQQKALQEQVQSTLAENRSLQEKVRQYADREKASHKDRQEAVARSRDLQQKLQEALTENQSLQQQLATASGSEDLQEQLNAALAEHEALKQQLADDKVKRQALADKIKAAETLKKSLRTRLANTNEKKKTLQTDNKSLRQQLSAVTDQCHAARNELADTVDRCDKLQQQLQGIRTREETGQEQLQRTDQELTSLREQLTESTLRFQTGEEQRQIVEQANRELTAQVTELNTNLQSLQEEVERARAQIPDDVRQQWQRRIDQLQAALDDQQTTNDKLSAELTGVREQLSRVSDQPAVAAGTGDAAGREIAAKLEHKRTKLRLVKSKLREKLILIHEMQSKTRGVHKRLQELREQSPDHAPAIAELERQLKEIYRQPPGSSENSDPRRTPG
jgi:predicted  nucleic acid-binding Zn-ribbon protein